MTSRGVSRRQFLRTSAGAAGVAVLLALHALLLWPVHGFVVSDATGYLANARWLAHRATVAFVTPASSRLVLLRMCMRVREYKEEL